MGATQPRKILKALIYPSGGKCKTVANVVVVIGVRNIIYLTVTKNKVKFNDIDEQIPIGQTRAHGKPKNSLKSICAM